MRGQREAVRAAARGRGRLAGKHIAAPSLGTRFLCDCSCYAGAIMSNSHMPALSLCTLKLHKLSVRRAGAAGGLAGREVRSGHVPGAVVHHGGAEPPVRHLPLPGALLRRARARHALCCSTVLLSCAMPLPEQYGCAAACCPGRCTLTDTVLASNRQAVWQDPVAHPEGRRRLPGEEYRADLQAAGLHLASPQTVLRFVSSSLFAIRSCLGTVMAVKSV